MATKAQYREGGRLLIEDFTTEYIPTTLNVAGNQGYAQIQGNFEDGDIVHITEPADLAGDYVVSSYDGNESLGFMALFGLAAADVDGETVKGYKLQMLPACWVEDFTLTLGQWNTEEKKDGCGNIYTLTTDFERGEATFNFTENWDISLQLALKNEFQKKAPSVAVSFEPVALDEVGNKALIGLAEVWRGTVTGIDLDRPLDGVSTGTINLKVSSEIVTARIA